METCKKLICLLDTESLSRCSAKDVCLTWTATQDAIRKHRHTIYTTIPESMSFDFIKDGYGLYLVKNNETLHIYPGMRMPDNKDIRIGHHIPKLIYSGFFDTMFRDENQK